MKSIAKLSKKWPNAVKNVAKQRIETILQTDILMSFFFSKLRLVNCTMIVLGVGQWLLWIPASGTSVDNGATFEN